jgi:hypothetical protein
MRIGRTSTKAIQVDLPPGHRRRIRSPIIDRAARQAISHESGRRIVTARMLSALLRRPNPTSMSEPGQSDELRIADPAAMQRTIGMSAHARVEASTGRQQSAMSSQIKNPAQGTQRAGSRAQRLQRAAVRLGALPFGAGHDAWNP